MSPNDAELNVTVDWLASVARGNGGLPNRVDGLARAFVTPPAAEDARHAWRTLGALLEEVRYVVFNIPAHLAEEQRRHFVAVLKPLANAEDYAWRATGSEIADDESCAVHIASDASKENGGLFSKLTAEWKWVWHEYAKLTYALEARSVFTWNQLLLHGCRDPKPFGLSWNGSGDLQQYYLEADERMLDTLDIGVRREASGAAWNSALAELSPRMDGWPRLSSDVHRFFSKLAPLDRVDLEQTAPAAIYHLLRSYGRWGGGAFLSIPVVLASGSDRNTSAVLSLCSERPLSAESIVRWRLLAECILPVISSSELVTQFHARKAAEQEAVHQAAAWAHEVKNRTAPIIACLRRAAAGERALDSDASRAFHGALILHAVSIAVHRALGGNQPVAQLTGKEAAPLLEALLQYLLNYHAATTRDQLLWEPRWSVAECVERLGTLLRVSATQSLAERAKAVLTDPKVICAAALLRELVQNIRVNGAVRGDRTINIRYLMQEDTLGGTLTVVLDQRQKERAVTFNPELGRGIQHANKLFGAGRMNIGHIEADPVVVTESGETAWDGFDVLIRSRAVFMVEESDAHA